jgi:excisionase family DNA binding protein
MSIVDAQFRYVSVTEAASLLGVTTGRIRQLLRAGDLHGHKLGEKSWALDPAEITLRKLNPPKRGRPARNSKTRHSLRKSKKIS